MPQANVGLRADVCCTCQCGTGLCTRATAEVVWGEAKASAVHQLQHVTDWSPRSILPDLG